MSEDNFHKVDKLALIQEQEERAVTQVAIIEQRCESNPVAFIKENYNYAKIRERSSEIDIRAVIGAAMVKAAGHIGIKTIDLPNKQDISRMILSSYSDLTIEEIYKAFELERYGSYEDKTEHFQLFNSEYVAAILKKYRKWKQDTKIHHNISPPQKLPEITDSQKKEIVDNGIIRVFNEFKETGEMPEPCSHIFDELYERKIIRDGQTPGEQAYYQRKYSEAAVQIERELKSENTGSLQELRTIKEELDKIGQNNSDKVILRIKKLILIDLFTRLIDSNTHIIEKMQ